jgi:hypothetical protein
MTQQPFTPAGVQAMQDELNQLSNQDLQTQVDLIRSDLRSWVADNFTLDTGQQSYLNSIDDSFFDYASGVTAFAVLHGLPVALSASQTPTTFKLIHASDDIVVTFSPNGVSYTGGVTYTVEYQ